ncbi:MAG: serine/threonine-protein kinase [Planctomycetota bacterium]
MELSQTPEPNDAADKAAPGIHWEAFYQNYRKPGYVSGFEIINKLGGGMFGLVFKARKESIGKDYAIKFLKVDDEVVRDAVLRELRSVDLFAQIDHPNLVSIEDKGSVDGIPFIVMSYAGEETLRKRLDRGDLSHDDALKIFVQAARGVQALHERSLVHFDLKPANVFLRGDVARVGDYGLSKLVSESRNSLSFGRGTPYYMAPEMLHRRGDSRSDVYSLGVLLFESLVGEVPFQGDSEWEVLKKHEEAPVEVPSQIGRPVRQVIERCLAKDPDARPTVREVLQMLSAPASLGESLVFPRSGVAGAAAVVTPSQPDSAPSKDITPPPIPTPPPTDLGSVPVVEPEDDENWDSDWDEPAPPRSASRRASSRATPRPEPNRTLIGRLIQGVFSLFEFAVLCVLVPIRGAAELVGRTTVFLVRLPFQVLGMVFNLAGYLAIAVILVVLLLGAFSLLGAGRLEDSGPRRHVITVPASGELEVRSGADAPEQGR